ncbi:hypothetical protein WA158_001097 [Blastocystis sp. Blastoise]
MKLSLICLLLLIVNAAQVLDTQILWKRKEPELYGCYRIPALLHLEDDILVAAIEARQGNCNDATQSDTMVKVSKDNGSTWSESIKIDFFSKVNGTDSTGEPALIYDKTIKKLFLITEFFHSDAHMNGNPVIDIRIAESTDYGYTWTLNQIIPDPGEHAPTGTLTSGIQLDSGRLIIGYRRGDRNSYAFMSDDHGIHWRLSTNSSGTGGSECQVTKLRDGRLYQTSRGYYDVQGNPRLQSFSHDDGETWEQFTSIPATIMPDPNCQGSVATDKEGNLYISHANHTSQRIDMTINQSKDSSLTWTDSLLVKKGFVAYSSLTALDDGRIAILFEGGDKDSYENIYFSRVKF